MYKRPWELWWRGQVFGNCLLLVLLLKRLIGNIFGLKALRLLAAFSFVELLISFHFSFYSFGKRFFVDFLFIFIPIFCWNPFYLSSYSSFISLVKNCNHKGLGIYYLLSAFIFGISGTLISVLIRIELYSSGNRIISPENQNFYNIIIHH